MDKTAKADIKHIRQRTQFTCMATSMSACLYALDIDVSEDDVNKVMGAAPLRGASWEDALACAQYFGCRGTLIAPCTVGQLKSWIDRGLPAMIAWNPEGRPWSHASAVFDVTEKNIHIMDPNIPDPQQTDRSVTHEEFYKKWFEDRGNYLVRRPALLLDREVTHDGVQKLANGGPLSTIRDYGIPADDFSHLLDDEASMPLEMYPRKRL